MTEIDERNELRDGRILAAAKRLIDTVGLSGMTRESLATASGNSPASVSNFGRHRISNGAHGREGYRERILAALMAEAIEQGDVRMLRVGLADGSLRPADIPDPLREAVLS